MPVHPVETRSTRTRTFLRVATLALLAWATGLVILLALASASRAAPMASKPAPAAEIRPEPANGGAAVETRAQRIPIITYRPPRPGKPVRTTGGATRGGHLIPTR